MDNITLTPEMLALIPVVAAILQVLKKIPLIANYTAWFPFAGIGIAYGVLYASGVSQNIVAAIILGLMASGAYEAFKGTTAK